MDILNLDIFRHYTVMLKKKFNKKERVCTAEVRKGRSPVFVWTPQGDSF